MNISNNLKDNFKNFKINVTRIISLVMTALGAYVIHETYGFRKSMFDPVGPGVYPRLLGWLMIVLSILIFFTTPNGSSKKKKLDYKAMVFVGGAMLLYALLVEPVGFVPATFPFMLAIPMYFKTVEKKFCVVYAAV